MRRYLVIVLVGCGVELGEPPDVDDDDRDGKSDEGHDDDDDDDHGGGGPTPLTATKFLSRIGEQYCDESFRCEASYPAGSTAFDEDFGTTKQACEAGVDAYYEPALVEQSITAGRVVFSATAGKACLDGISYPQQCSVFWDTDPVFPQACDATLVGTIADGATCTSIFDCANLTSVCDDMTKRCTP